VPNYFPIPVTPAIRAGDISLLKLQWVDREVIAYFDVPADNEAALKVEFKHAEIVRIVEEMPLSTEPEETANEGLIAHHLAYRVEGASFWNTQSAVFKDFYKEAKHYRFLTGSYCLDVIALDQPAFELVSKTVLLQ
jgi:hypothetical protein